jgi:hypothetical protein
MPITPPSLLTAAEIEEGEMTEPQMFDTRGGVPEWANLHMDKLLERAIEAETLNREMREALRRIANLGDHPIAELAQRNAAEIARAAIAKAEGRGAFQ